jgi:hypothetical protein
MHDYELVDAVRDLSAYLLASADLSDSRKGRPRAKNSVGLTPFWSPASTKESRHSVTISRFVRAALGSMLLAASLCACDQPVTTKSALPFELAPHARLHAAPSPASLP